MKPTCRPYQTEDDYWRMREFLRQVLVLNHKLQRSWHVARLDYARWHTCLNCAGVGLEDVAYLWETEGQIVAMMLPDGGPGEAHLAIHPILRTAELEEEMLAVAEDRLAISGTDGISKLLVWASEQDGLRQDLLLQRGYVKEGWPETQWCRSLDTHIQDVPVPPGYTLRALGDGLELLERCYASGLGFHAGDIQIAVENRNDPTWYHNIQNAPLYRRDLDLVAIAPDGSIAAFCTIWFDDVTRTAYFEPVATLLAHQKRGLGKAILTEGLRRLRHMGATTAFVSGYSPEANHLYAAIMGPEHELNEPWVKSWLKR